MGVVQSIGKRIPEDIPFIGFTDGILSRYSKPTLTTVAQHGDKMGEVAAKLLIDRVESDNEETEAPFQTEVISATLIKRESTIN
jgi:LacI family transcriptional regulator